MKLSTTVLALAVATCPLGAQEQLPPPYQEGDVHAFLARARANDRPAAVLFNFNLDSG